MTNRGHDDLGRSAGGRRFATVLASPPWQFVNRTGKMAPEHKRLNRYETLTTDAIARCRQPGRANRSRPGRLAGVLLALAALAAMALRPQPASADAALAVGLPADVAKHGIAMGYALSYATREAAQAEALKRCRGFQDAPQSTRDLCKIVENFRNRCIAIALDPDIGTTGRGWAVAKKQEAAEEAAMEKCIDTAGKRRRDFCRITFTRCDRK